MGLLQTGARRCRRTTGRRRRCRPEPIAPACRTSVDLRETDPPPLRSTEGGEQGRVMVGASKGRMPNLRKDASPRGACSLESRPEVQARVQRRGGESARAVSKGSNPTPNRRPQIAGQKLPALTRNGARAAPVRGVQAEAPEHISPAPLPPPPRQTFPDPCLDS